MSITPKWPLAWKTFYEKAALDYVLLPDGVRNTLDNLTPEGRGSYQSVKTLRATNQGSTVGRREAQGHNMCTDQQFCCVLSDNIPHSAMSNDGTSLLHYLHKFLNHQLANEYYKTVTKYCKAAKPSMVSAAGTSANGQYIEREG
ncbi:hypothetical protein EDD15DRAFT_2195209 [Pisolithus albus]|nr:hypothetical protein EDD15DRAFT_2195209 [Pisolithus albus]